MASLLDLEMAQKSVRPKQLDLQKKMVRRITEISNAISHLRAVMRDCSSQQDTCYLPAGIMTDRIDEAKHVLSADNFTYRSTFETELSYQERNGKQLQKLSFLLELQNEIISVKGITNSMGIVRNTRTFSAGQALSIHIDISSTISLYPSTRMEVKTLGDCVLEKVRRKVQDVLGNERYFCRILLAFHVHIDVCSYMPLPTLLSHERELASFSHNPAHSNVDNRAQPEPDLQLGVSV